MPTLEQINRGATHYDTEARTARYWAGYHRQLGSIRHADEWSRREQQARKIAAELRALVAPLPDDAV